MKLELLTYNKEYPENLDDSCHHCNRNLKLIKITRDANWKGKIDS